MELTVRWRKADPRPDAYQIHISLHIVVRILRRLHREGGGEVGEEKDLLKRELRFIRR